MGEKSIEQIIIESSNNIALELLKILEENEWNVEFSPYYIDKSSEKDREIDLLAKKNIRCKSTNRSSFEIILCIECKYLNKDKNFIIRTFKNDLERKDFVKGTNGIYVNKEFREKNHHYSLHQNIGKLYDTKGANKKDFFIDGIIKPIKKCIFLQDNYNNLGAFIFPVSVFGGIENFFYTSPNTKEPEESKHSLYKVGFNYYPKNSTSIKKDFFVVDIVTLNNFKCFLKELDNSIHELYYGAN